MSARPSTSIAVCGHVGVRRLEIWHESECRWSTELPAFVEQADHRLKAIGRRFRRIAQGGARRLSPTLPLQAEILHEVLDACAAEGGRTISLHSRGAVETLLDMLEFEPLAGRFVVHWFSARMALVERAVKLSCWFSVGSAMMASRSGRSAIAAMPFDRIIPETDGPFGSINGEALTPGGAASSTMSTQR